MSSVSNTIDTELGWLFVHTESWRERNEIQAPAIGCRLVQTSRGNLGMEDVHIVLFSVVQMLFVKPTLDL